MVDKNEWVIADAQLRVLSELAAERPKALKLLWHLVCSSENDLRVTLERRIENRERLVHCLARIVKEWRAPDRLTVIGEANASCGASVMAVCFGKQAYAKRMSKKGLRQLGALIETACVSCRPSWLETLILRAPNGIGKGLRHRQTGIKRAFRCIVHQWLQRTQADGNEDLEQRILRAIKRVWQGSKQPNKTSATSDK